MESELEFKAMDIIDDHRKHNFMVRGHPENISDDNNTPRMWQTHPLQLGSSQPSILKYHHHAILQRRWRPRG